MKFSVLFLRSNIEVLEYIRFYSDSQSNWTKLYTVPSTYNNKNALFIGTEIHSTHCVKLKINGTLVDPTYDISNSTRVSYDKVDTSAHIRIWTFSLSTDMTICYVTGSGYEYGHMIIY